MLTYVQIALFVTMLNLSKTFMKGVDVNFFIPFLFHIIILDFKESKISEATNLLKIFFAHFVYQNTFLCHITAQM